MIEITMVRDYNKDYNIKFDGLKVIDLRYEDGDKPNHCILGDAGTELLINKINEIIDYIMEDK